jgi:hypothetical protein
VTLDLAEYEVYPYGVTENSFAREEQLILSLCSNITRVSPRAAGDIQTLRFPGRMHLRGCNRS